MSVQEFQESCIAISYITFLVCSVFVVFVRKESDLKTY